MNSPQLSIIYESLLDTEQLGSPLEIKKYSLAKMSESKAIYLKICFINVSESNIAAFRIRVDCYDSLGEQIDSHLNPLMRTYQDIVIPGKSEFDPKEWISLEERIEARRIRISFDRILKQDGSIWLPESNSSISLPVTDFPDKKQIEDLRSIAGNDAIVFAFQNDSSWICVCGKVNGINQNPCKRCGREKSAVLSSLTRSNATILIKSRNDKLDQLEQAKNEKSRLIAIQNKTARRKKILKLIIIVFIATMVMLLSYFFGIPFAKSIYAESMISTGNYEEALNIYKSLPEFMKSDHKYISTYMRYAYSMIDHGDYPSAQSFLKIEDSNYLFASVKDEMIYMQAFCAEKSGLYSDALSIIEKCTYNFYSEFDNKDRNTKKDEISFALAQEFEHNNNLVEAYKLYNDIKSIDAAINKVADMKKKMSSDSTALKSDINIALINQDIETSRTLLNKLVQIENNYFAMFSTSLELFSYIMKIENRIVNDESLTKIDLLLDKYDKAIENNEYINAIRFLKDVNDINNNCMTTTGKLAISESEISDRFNIASSRKLAQVPDDILETVFVGQAYLKTGTNADGGTKKKIFKQGASFGLLVNKIYIEDNIHVNWYQRKFDFLESTEKSVLITQHEPAEYNGNGWYFYFTESNLDKGYYYAELVYQYGSTSDNLIGRFYFQIN